MMRASTSAKSRSGHRSGDKVSETPTKRSQKQKPKWKVVGDKVYLPPGDYTLDDIESMRKAIQGVTQ